MSMDSVPILEFAFNAILFGHSAFDKTLVVKMSRISDIRINSVIIVKNKSVTRSWFKIAKKLRKS